MRQRFCLTKLCHLFLESRTYPKGVFIDMTLGRGHDLSFLLDLVAPDWDHLMGIDLQKEALEASFQRLEARGLSKECQAIQWRLGNHSSIQQWLEEWPLAAKGVSLALYNLGYLPGSDKKITTESSSTLKSLELLLSWISPGGGVSLVIYPGHREGAVEALALDAFFEEKIDPKKWQLWQTRRFQREETPYWVWMQKQF